MFCNLPAHVFFGENLNHMTRIWVFVLSRNAQRHVTMLRFCKGLLTRCCSQFPCMCYIRHILLHSKLHVGIYDEMKIKMSLIKRLEHGAWIMSSIRNVFVNMLVFWRGGCDVKARRVLEIYVRILEILCQND